MILVFVLLVLGISLAYLIVDWLWKYRFFREDYGIVIVIIIAFTILLGIPYILSLLWS